MLSSPFVKILDPPAAMIRAGSSVSGVSEGKGGSHNADPLNPPHSNLGVSAVPDFTIDRESSSFRNKRDRLLKSAQYRYFFHRIRYALNLLSGPCISTACLNSQIASRSFRGDANMKFDRGLLVRCVSLTESCSETSSLQR